LFLDTSITLGSATVAARPNAAWHSYLRKRSGCGRQKGSAANKRNWESEKEQQSALPGSIGTGGDRA